MTFRSIPGILFWAFIAQAKARMSYEVPVKKLRRICNLQGLKCKTSEELKATKAIIGQREQAG